MSCSEIRSLLAYRSLDLLEGDERSAVESHLASCAACRLEVDAAGEIAAFLKAPRRDEKPSERVWEALRERLDAPGEAAVAAPSRTSMSLACATCSGGLEEGAAVYCASCLAPHHGDCFTRCTVTGCEGTRLVTARAPRRSFAAPLVVLGAVAIGAVFLVQRGYDELLEESRRNQQLESDLRKFIVVKKAAPAPAPAAPAIPERIDVASDGEELSVVLDRIGAQVHQNIVVDPSVHEKVRVKLHDVRWQDAVSVIAALVKCDVVKRGDVLVLMKPVLAPSDVQPVPHQEDPKEDAPPPPLPLKFQGFVESARAGQVSKAVINDRTYSEGDEIVGKDGKSFSPKLFVAKIRTDGVEVATGSLDGPRTLLGR